MLQLLHKKCNETIAALTSENKKLNQQGANLAAANKRQAAMIAELRETLKIATNYNLDERYRGMPTMAEMIKDGRAIPCSTADMQMQWQKQFNLRLSTINNYDPIKKTCHWSQTGLASYRLPRSVIEEFLRRTPVNLWTYNPANDTDGRTFACNDFAIALFSELNRSPYWDAWLGVVAVKNHRINAVWFSDHPDIHYIEPQTDRIWLPDINNEKDIPYELLI